MSLIELYSQFKVLDDDKAKKTQWGTNRKYPTDKESWHCYISEYYSPRFENFECKSLLEIGIYAGGSLLLWRDYFPNATIHGMDVNVTSSKPVLKDNSDRIIVKKLNAYSKEAMSYLSNKKFDIIIDDGPHTLKSMLYFTKNYPKYLTDGGICVIEDIQKESWIDDIVKVIPEGYGHKVIDLRHVKDRYDDLILEIFKDG